MVLSSAKNSPSSSNPEDAPRSPQFFQWLGLCLRTKKTKRLPPFIRLAKERRFDEICHILKQPDTDSSWLNVSQDSRISTCESLHVLCLERPTVTSVVAVIEKLNAANKNSIDAAVVVDVHGRTPLHIAAGSGCSAAVMERLMWENTAVLTMDHARRYPLHWACAAAKQQRRSKKSIDDLFQAINSLIEAYPIAVITKDRQGKTPFDLAVSNEADYRIIAALHFVTKILPANNHAAAVKHDPQQVASLHTESTLVEIPREVAYDDDDDVSSVGSRGVSRHPRTFRFAV